MKLKSTAFVLVVAMAMTAAVAAQNQSNVPEDPGPGLVGSGSMIYGLEVAWDNAAMSVGLKRAGDVATERAAEARQATERNQTEAAVRAANNLRDLVNRTDEEDSAGLEQAMDMMRETIRNAPNDQARQGMYTALRNMEEAMQRRQEARNRTQGSDNPDSTGPDSSDNRTGDRQTDQNRTQDRDGSDTAGNTSRRP